MTLTLFRWLSHTIRLFLCLHIAVRTPRILLSTVWPLPRSLATTSGISVDFSSSPYLDVSVQAVPLVYLWIQYTIHKLHLCGLLHSEIHGSMPTYGSPWLIAVSRVLLRLSVPRHSPCALCSLTMCFLVLLEIVDLSIKSSSFLDSFLALSASFLYSVFNVHQLRWRDVRQLRWTDARLRINPRSLLSYVSYFLPEVCSTSFGSFLRPSRPAI